MLIKVMLCWTDKAGTARTALDDRTAVLVNDFDLPLYAPDGTVFRSPQLNPANPTALPVYNGNSIDTVERRGGFG